jgi:hypothetical protein
VNVHLTLGYAFNLWRKPLEGSGALAVRLSMGDLFR